MLFPSVNSKAAIIGGISSLIIPVWAWIGNLVTKPNLGRGPLSTEYCFNVTTVKHSVYHETELSWLQQFYATNTLWYPCWSVVIGILVTLIASKFKCGSQDPSAVNPELFFPVIRKRIIRKYQSKALDINDTNGIPLK
ncbi:hypothetical protein CHUAL_002228 [Chamberlinius hualienensis]